MTPRVLIILATYNGDKWLSNLLDSIIKQSDVNINVLIGDDCSNDETKSIIKRYADFDDRFKINFFPVSSGSAGQNFIRLFAIADEKNFDYIALADQDDVWFESKLLNAINIIRKYKVKGYSSSVNAFWDSGKSKIISQSADIRLLDYLFEGAGQGCTFVIPSETFSYVKLFCIENPILVKSFHYHDWLIYLLVRCWGSSWYFDPIPQVFYRQHTSNEIGARSGLKSIFHRFSLIANGWYRTQLQSAVKISTAANMQAPGLASFSKLFNSPDSLKRRLLLSLSIFKYGRRRIVDRLVLIISSLMGYI